MVNFQTKRHKMSADSHIIGQLAPLPGIVALLRRIPDTGKCLTDLAQQLLVGTEPRSPLQKTRTRDNRDAHAFRQRTSVCFAPTVMPQSPTKVGKNQGQAMAFIEEFNPSNENQTPLMIEQGNIPRRLFYYMTIAKHVHQRKSKSDIAVFRGSGQKRGRDRRRSTRSRTDCRGIQHVQFIRRHTGSTVPPKGSPVYE